MSIHLSKTMCETFKEFPGLINWGYLSNNIALTEETFEYMKTLKDHVKWALISERISIDQKTLSLFQDELDWNVISERDDLSVDILRSFDNKIYFRNLNTVVLKRIIEAGAGLKFKDNLDWSYISGYITLTEAQIFDFRNYVNWPNIMWFQTLSDSFIRRMSDYIITTSKLLHITLQNIIIKQSVSFQFIEQFSGQINWDFVSKLVMGDDRIRLLGNYLNWEIMIKERTLSEEILNDMFGRIDWSLAFKHQSMSDTFICQMVKKLSNSVIITTVRTDGVITSETVKPVKIDWEGISKQKRLSLAFIREYGTFMKPYMNNTIKQNIQRGHSIAVIGLIDPMFEDILSIIGSYI